MYILCMIIDVAILYNEYHRIKKILSNGRGIYINLFLFFVAKTYIPGTSPALGGE